MQQYDIDANWSSYFCDGDLSIIARPGDSCEKSKSTL